MADYASTNADGTPYTGVGWSVLAPGSIVNSVDPNYNYGGGTSTYIDSTPPAGYNTSGGGTAPAPDPYAAYGGQAAYNSLVSGFNTQDQNIHSTSDEAAQSSALGQHGSILDFINSLTTSQNSINESGVQNELAKKQGMNSIMDMISQGLQSGGVLLANRNAGSSSATEAIARAYGKLGQREGNKVGNQYELGNRKIGLAQSDLERSKGLGLTKLGDSKAQAVNNIVLQARDRLATLDAAIASANLPNRIAIEQEKSQIQASVQNILNQYDPELSSGVAGITPTSADQNRSTAQGLAYAGTAATSPFDLSTTAPAQFQNGAQTSELPIFTAPRKRTA